MPVAAISFAWSSSQTHKVIAQIARDPRFSDRRASFSGLPDVRLSLVSCRALEQWLPPILVCQVPVDRLLESFTEIVQRFPVQLLLGKRAVNRVAAVVT